VIIEKMFEGDLDRYYYFSNSDLSFPISSLIIITPVFLIVTSQLHKQYKNGKLDPKSAIYRWLTYLMLLIASLTVAGSLIALVHNLLDGNYTTATLLKILVVFVLALAIFLYYWYDMRREDYKKTTTIAQLAFWGTVVITVASIVGGLVIADPPHIARKKKMDDQRVGDLTQLEYTITD